MLVSQTTAPWASRSPGAEARRAAAGQRGEEDPDADGVGCDQETEQRHADIPHGPWTQQDARHGKQQDHEAQGRRRKQQPYPPRQVDDVPAFRLVNGREAPEQRHINRQNDDRLGASLAHRSAGACVQLGSGGVRCR
jgi:hypothetical protein